MTNNNDNDVKRYSQDMTGLRDISDDELGFITELGVTVYKFALEGNPRPENKPLSPRIRLCKNITFLSLTHCSSIPPEISSCTMLTQLVVTDGKQNFGNCQIDLPTGIILEKLNFFAIEGRSWTCEAASKIIPWLASCCPNLNSLLCFSLTKETANLLMRMLQNNEAFINKLKHKLLAITFTQCNLNEADARSILFDINPLYPELGIIDLQNNNIECIETIGTVAKTLLPTNDSIPSTLRNLFLYGNPFFGNLSSPESSDHTAMICLLKYHQLLLRIESNKNNTTTYSSIIDYWLIVNASELRYLLDDGHGGARLSICPYVLKRAYDRRAQDPTTIFTFLRDGQIFRTTMMPTATTATATATATATTTTATTTTTTTTTTRTRYSSYLKSASYLTNYPELKSVSNK